MKANARLIIFALVIFAVGIVFAVPYLKPADKSLKKFTVTEQPARKLQAALDNGKPVYLEFYSAQ